MRKASGWHRKRKGTPAELARRRKYDAAEHQQARRIFAAQVAAGTARCWRCGKVLVPGGWQVGHDDVRTNVINGPECTVCNRRAAARKGALIRNAQAKAAGFVRARR